jgi:hypothetical protein
MHEPTCLWSVAEDPRRWMQGNTPSSYHNEYPQSEQESLELVPETLRFFPQIWRPQFISKCAWIQDLCDMSGISTLSVALEINLLYINQEF